MSVYTYRRGSIFWALTLIAVGTIFLWQNFNPAIHPWQIIAKFWPLLIIFWGVSKLIDFIRAQAHPEATPAPLFSGSEVVLLVLILALGTLVSKIVLHSSHPWGWNIYNDEIAGLFTNTYTYDQTFSQPVKSGSNLVLEDQRGDVEVHGADQPVIDVRVHKIIHAEDEDTAKKLADNLKFEVVEEAGHSVLRSNRHSLLENDRRISVDLDLRVPKALSSEVTSERGDIQVDGLKGDQTLSTQHGDVRATNIEGLIKIHKSGGTTEARDVKGSVELEGRGDDVEMADITGTVSINGEFSGDLEFRNVAQTLRFHSNRTDMTAQKLSGRLHMEAGSLEVNGIDGPLDVTTKQKDITVDDFKYSLRIVDSNGQVSLQTFAPLAHEIQVDAKNGAIELRLPAGSSFQIEANSRHGEVESDFEGPGLKVVKEGEAASISGTYGKGGPMIRLNTEYGAIRLLHAGPHPPTPPAPPAPPKPPVAPAPPTPPARPPKTVATWRLDSPFRPAPAVRGRRAVCPLPAVRVARFAEFVQHLEAHLEKLRVSDFRFQVF